MAAPEALVSMTGVTVRYGATEAVRDVDLEIRAGEVHALVGENGAGKSTLLRAIAGAVPLASGAMRARDAIALDWVPQEADLPPDLTAADWIFLGRERRRFGFLARDAMRADAAAALAAVGCRIDPCAPIGAAQVAERKQVQLARGLAGRPDVLLLDEPTAVLGDAETRRLFAAVRAERARGAGVVYVSHRLDEVMSIADRVTVLRDGRRVSTDPVGEVSAAKLVARMVGRDIPERAAMARTPGAELLRVEDLSVAHVRGVSFRVRAGEIVGLAGLVGAGRSEVLEAIAGLRPPLAGRIDASGKPVFVPEDRAAKGLVRALDLTENLFLPAPRWRIDRGEERRAARQWIERLAIRATGVDAPIESLSGGNQQKLLLARALRHGPRLLLLDEPTAGVDVAAKEEIHEAIRALAGGGAAIVLASSDLPELLALADEIVALRTGRVAGALARSEADEPRVAGLITGGAS